MPNVPIHADPEGFGIAPLQASVAGLWVLASSLQGIPDAILNGQNGILLPTKDAGAWLTELKRWLADPIMCRREGGAGRDVTLGHFSWPSIADRYASEFRALGVI
jgi:glycosyltransferase involved in cell wall biosynthesis